MYRVYLIPVTVDDDGQYIYIYYICVCVNELPTIRTSMTVSKKVETNLDAKRAALGK